MTILIVEDDHVTAQAMAEIAVELGHRADVVETFDDCLIAVEQHAPDLVLLDRMLPGGDGLDAIAKLRLKGAGCLVMVVSARGRSNNRVEGLEKGADDYLAKPFDPQELRARMKALLRRNAVQMTDNDLLVFHDLEIRLKARTVHRAGQYFAVSPKEFELICYFADNANEVVTRKMLLEHVWKLSFDPQTNVVDVHVGRLRRKLEINDLLPLIHTVRGEGYLFTSDPVGT